MRIFYLKETELLVVVGISAESARAEGSILEPTAIPSSMSENSIRVQAYT